MLFKKVQSVEFSKVKNLLEQDIQEVYKDQYSAYDFTLYEGIQFQKINEEIANNKAYCYHIFKEDESSEVVGYCLMYRMQERFQHDKTTAVCSAIFIDKTVRSYKLFKDFLTFIELDLIDENIDVISMSVKRSHSKLMSRLFYQEEEVCFTKKLSK